jgi:hypothetical protein
MAHLDPDQLRVATDAMRRMIDGSGYGHFVTDAQCREAAAAILQALADLKSGRTL